MWLCGGSMPCHKSKGLNWWNKKCSSYEDLSWTSISLLRCICGKEFAKWEICLLDLHKTAWTILKFIGTGKWVWSCYRLDMALILTNTNLTLVKKKNGRRSQALSAAIEWGDHFPVNFSLKPSRILVLYIGKLPYKLEYSASCYDQFLTPK